MTCFIAAHYYKYARYICYYCRLVFCLEVVLLQQRAHSAEPFSPDYGAENSKDSEVMIGATMLGISNLSARFLTSV